MKTMKEHEINGTTIRTDWISDPIDEMPVLVLPDDMDLDSTSYHEIYGSLFGKLPIFCIDTMYRNGKKLEFGEAIPLEQQIDEACQILALENINSAVWLGDCSRAAFACRAAVQHPNSRLILSAPLFTDNGMRPRLAILRKLLHGVVSKDDITSFTCVDSFLTMGAKYHEENPFGFMAANRRNRLVSAKQRELMLAHCFPDEVDPENMLEDIRGEILVISGTDDTLQHLRLLKMRLAGLENCTHKVYESGHTVFAEHPEHFLQDIFEFCGHANE